MNPNFDLAATKATEILVNYKIGRTPVSPLQILLNYPGVRIMTFSEMADRQLMDRKDLLPIFGKNQDAATFRLEMDINDVCYVVLYNMILPFETVRKGLARELGHIVLGHDGVTRPTEVRYAEAMAFAIHLLSPRPVIRMLQDSGLPVTTNVLKGTIGCSDECVELMQNTPGVHVPKELNAAVHDLFAQGISEYIRFKQAERKEDHSPVVDFGRYMDFYSE